MRLFQPEISRIPAVRPIGPGEKRRAAVRKDSPGPTRRPKPGAGFEVWFNYLLGSTTLYFSRLADQGARGRAARSGRRVQLEKWAHQLPAFRGLLEPAIKRRPWQWDLRRSNAEAHFIFYPDRPSRERKFEVFLQVRFVPGRMIVTGLGLELIDQTGTDPRDYFERHRGFRMQISSSSSSYLATPPPSGR